MNTENAFLVVDVSSSDIPFCCVVLYINSKERLLVFRVITRPDIRMNDKLSHFSDVISHAAFTSCSDLVLRYSLI